MIGYSFDCITYYNKKIGSTKQKFTSQLCVTYVKKYFALSLFRYIYTYAS